MDRNVIRKLGIMMFVCMVFAALLALPVAAQAEEYLAYTSETYRNSADIDLTKFETWHAPSGAITREQETPGTGEPPAVKDIYHYEYKDSVTGEVTRSEDFVVPLT